MWPVANQGCGYLWSHDNGHFYAPVLTLIYDTRKQLFLQG
jgi:hypothetical protein